MSSQPLRQVMRRSGRPRPAPVHAGAGRVGRLNMTENWWFPAMPGGGPRPALHAGVPERPN